MSGVMVLAARGLYREYGSVYGNALEFQTTSQCFLADLYITTKNFTKHNMKFVKGRSPIIFKAVTIVITLGNKTCEFLVIHVILWYKEVTAKMNEGEKYSRSFRCRLQQLKNFIYHSHVVISKQTLVILRNFLSFICWYFLHIFSVATDYFEEPWLQTFSYTI